MKITKPHWKTSIISSLGVFFLFGTLGFAVDVMKMGRAPVLRLWLSVVMFGGFAIGYATVAYVFRRKWRKALVLMLAILIVQNSLMSLLFWLIPDAPAPSQMQASDIAQMHGRLNVSADASMVAMVLAYVCFLYVVITEGRRRVQIQTEMELAAQVHRGLVRPGPTILSDRSPMPMPPMFLAFCGHSALLLLHVSR